MCAQTTRPPSPDYPPRIGVGDLPDAARHVLHAYDLGGHEAGSFVTALVRAFIAGDSQQRAILGSVYPTYGRVMLALDGRLDRYDADWHPRDPLDATALGLERVRAWAAGEPDDDARAW